MIRRRISTGAVPVSLADAKAHLRVTDSAEDALITAMVAAACGLVAETAGRVLSAETWEICDTGYSGWVEVPVSPVTALSAVSYLDGTGAEVAATVGDFTLTVSDDRVFVGPRPGKAWPTPGVVRPDAVRVRVTAGYTTLPPELKQAILLAVGHNYRNREAVGEAMAELPLAFASLVNVHRLGWAAG